MKRIFTQVALLVAVAILALTATSYGTAGNTKKISSAPATFNLATYNIRLYNPGDSIAGEVWQTRSKEIARVARFHQFDIFGTQEGFRHQLNDLKALLPGYEYIGAGRDDGKRKGEHSAIFYNTSLFRCLDHGDFWLSEHPDRPGLGWDAACPRICTWGRFRHIPSGREFLYFNLHMDHIGKVARVESGKLIQRKIADLGSKLPTILSGDFNVSQRGECYTSIVNAGYFSDSHELADIILDNGSTYNDWDPSWYTDERIDHIFVSPGISVARYGILTDHYYTTDGGKSRQHLPSDHYPVLVTLTLPAD